MPRLACALALVMGCAESSPMVTRDVGPPSSGWTTPRTHAACAPRDVAPRLHLARVSHLSWMDANGRVELAETDVSDTRGADAERLNRLAIEGALREVAPLALAGEPAIADALRAAPPLDADKDLQTALGIVSRARAELEPESERDALLAILEDALGDALMHPAAGGRCAEIVGHGTAEARVAAAAIEAGAPRGEVTHASVALLDQMADAARDERPA